MQTVLILQLCYKICSHIKKTVLMSIIVVKWVETQIQRHFLGSRTTCESNIFKKNMRKQLGNKCVTKLPMNY